MLKRPKIWTRLLGQLHGEVPADTLEAYRRASLAVYELLQQVERGRQRAEDNPWSTPPSVQIERLCAWNAFVLQTLGDQLLEADYRAKPATAGCVPPVTADQVLAFYSQVEEWLSRAQQAHYNPGFRLDVAVPAQLPTWCEVYSRPLRHIIGLRDALHLIRDHARGAIASFAGFEPEAATARAQHYRIQQLYAAADSKARYLEDLFGVRPNAALGHHAEPLIKEALELFYLLGQWLAMPGLAEDESWALSESEQPPAQRLAPTETTPPLPGEAGFDLWCLTAREGRDVLKSDPRARQALKELWEHDPDPAQTLAIQEEINEALARGDIQYATDRYGQPLGYYNCCPWGAAYVVVRALNIAGQSLHVLEQFTYQIEREDGNFHRRIAVGTFYPTTRVGYNH